MFNNPRINRKIVFVISITMVLLVMYLSNSLPSKDYRLVKSDLIDLNSGWTLEYDGNVLENVTLPYDLGLKENTPYTASLVLPDELRENIRLRIRSSMQDIVVYVNGIEVFRDVKENGSSLMVPDASLWHLFKLPNNIEGQELKLEMISPTMAFSGVINEVYAGDGKDLLYNIARNNIFNISLSTLFFIFGFFTLLLGIILKNLGDNRLLYLGIFAVLVSLWIFTESKIMQVFTGNRFIIGGLSYMLVPSIPMAFSLFLKESILKKYRDIMVVFAFMFLINLFINLYLQLAGIANLISSVQLTIVLILCALSSALFFMILEWRKYGNQQAKNMLIFSSILSIFLIIEAIIFFLGKYEYTSLYSGIGIFVFFTLISVSTFRSVNEMLLNERESEILKKLAYKDILTNMGNRAAYEKYLDKLRENVKGKEFRLVMMDINNLKFINDNFGHKEGDKAIISCSSVIEETLKPHGQCFRIGGDEFACILMELDDEGYDNQVQRMKEKLEIINGENPYVLDIAIGSNVYNYNKHEDISEFIHDTDLKMYTNKKLMKST